MQEKNPLRLAILGSTGSIGQQALEVAAKLSDQIRVVALAAGNNIEKLLEQAHAFNVPNLALARRPERIPGYLRGTQLIAYGDEAVAALAELEEVDCVLNAMVGAAGLRASYAALAAGKRLALANKESLVIGGDLLMMMAKTGQLIPVDSEHSAIFQCLWGENPSEVKRIWLTASGGPFRGYDRIGLASMKASDALAHPTWNMGAKISIDSATMMNKGLEVIEAMHLFGLSIDEIDVLVHPQSVIHSMVEFVDGSVKAQLGLTDMRIPIQYARSFPERWPGITESLDFRVLSELTFEAPDLLNFGCLKLAIDAAKAGGTAGAVLNAANEIAVQAFLEGKCNFLGIELCVSEVLKAHTVEPVESIDQLEAVDAWAREQATAMLGLSS
jgi:1-deoxy-D-xylulose-5-phosphate reductoisomerase